MTLPDGTLLGPYRVLEPLGAGGMGEVYKARDTRLERDVAIKVLPARAAADPDARARFTREAKAVSQLNHPNICVLYDVGEAPGPDAEPIHYLVMEYLEGESLAARLARGPLAADEALDLAQQIADALDKAHRRGIVHRDLKPANIMLVRGGPAGTRPAGAVAKLLDFGLAKLAPPPTIGTAETILAPGSGGATMPPATAAGTILGTFQYMAPEQLEGQAVDARADIWAFGCVLYEMLTGRRAFEGRTQASLIAGILGREPTPATELQPLTPPALNRVIRICLAKDPDARYQSSYDLLLQLQWIAEGGSAAGLPAPVIEHRKRRERTLWVAGMVATLVVGALTAWLLKPAPAVTNVTGRWSFPLPEGQRFTRPGQRSVAISPDGRRMAYVANQQIYVREMSQLTSQPVPGTDENPVGVTFSPDGQWLAYFTTAERGFLTLQKIPIAGGTPTPLCRTQGGASGLRWQGGTLVFAQGRTIQSVPDTGGEPKMLVPAGPFEQLADPYLVDGGRRVMFTAREPLIAWSAAKIVIQAPGESTPTVLVEEATDGRLVGDEYLIFYRGGTLFGMGFDARAYVTRGGPFPLVEGVQDFTNGRGAQAVLADNGTLVFVPGTLSDAAGRTLVWVDRQGHETPIPAPELEYRNPSVSPDGTRLVITVVRTANPLSSLLYVWDFTRPNPILQRISPPGGQFDGYAHWMPDGRTILYKSVDPDGTAALMRINANGAGKPEKVFDLGKTEQNTFPESIAPDGKTVTVRRWSSGNSDVMVLRLDSTEPQWRPLLDSPGFEHFSVISPSGTMLAYAYSENKIPTGFPVKAFAAPYPDVTADRWPLSREIASELTWARSGREVFFETRGQLVGVTVEPGRPTPRFGPETDLFAISPYLGSQFPGTDYDTAPDGRFLMIKNPPPTVRSRTITVVTHWIDELKERVKGPSQP